MPSETVLDTVPEMPVQVATGVLKASAVRVGDSAELAAEVVAVVAPAEVVVAVEAVVVGGSVVIAALD